MEADEESLYRQREQLSLLYTIKLSSTPTNHVFDKVFNPNSTERFAARPSAIPTFGIRVQSLIDDLNINLTRIQTYRLPDIPVWDMKFPTVLYD